MPYAGCRMKKHHQSGSGKTYRKHAAHLSARKQGVYIHETHAYQSFQPDKRRDEME